ncbi:MAG: M10 family metallopeptidase C-terminal domain-containing protein [Pegethrix bostrychoides GSE-TBD4-15B]|jgi:Ca2+-binding RTX toxin-like protein|uniref:M10 family metallopeptidase C-terminal domain-containing protein n=1 Tax=Pegethrix bostrychoides GSE-TBD4-15B TaxID=2839662 RepID=A0A951U625_9CYAN|nr:M10 family metallopeptidase C-terminal domain-containing protein [Pegethrix bostrychoides GSE-TBD4-15B]
MSELITVNPGQASAGPLGLNIIGEGVIQAFQETPSTPVVATGSSLNDSISSAQPRDTTVFQIGGNAGNDDISGAAGDDTLSGGDGEDTIRGNSGNDIIDGGAQADNLLGGSGDDTIRAGNGIDVVNGGSGNDTIRGDQGNDTLMGGPGDDEIFGGNGNDTIIGNAGDDRLFGGAKSDILKGGGGDDILEGGSGRDLMKGGPGSDTFVFGPGSTGPGKLDRIFDFNPGEDQIELSQALLPGSGISELGEADFAVVREISLGAESTATLIYEQKSGIVYYNAPGGKDVPLFQLQPNLSGLSASDFTIT